ncbi:MAG: hypothetical protein LBE33_00585 [Zoogloeaceae bacterium]|nr:hypothetical protein [Zoogloeaceae bacterium]
MLAVLLAAADWGVGRWQQGLVQARKDYRASLDRLAFHAVRTGIEEIRHQEDGRYRIRLIVQNAFDEPIFVMMPAVDAFIQIGPQWVGVQIAEAPEAAMEGSVVRLVGERATDRYLTVEPTDYTESIPGYIHLKLNLEMIVSPEQNPQEEVGERKEDLILYLKDYRWASDKTRHGNPAFDEKPDFIPLRAWTLVPRSPKS